MVILQIIYALGVFFTFYTEMAKRLERVNFGWPVWVVIIITFSWPFKALLYFILHQLYGD